MLSSNICTKKYFAIGNELSTIFHILSEKWPLCRYYIELRSVLLLSKPDQTRIWSYVPSLNGTQRDHLVTQVPGEFRYLESWEKFFHVMSIAFKH
jgi:hypothetical protein